MRHLRRRRLRVLLTTMVAAGAVGLGLLAYFTDLLEQPELDTLDARFEIRGEQPAPADVVVVQVDDITFSELRQQWPFPRSLHGRLIDRLRADGAGVIAFDVQFTEESEPDEDIALYEAVARAGNLVLSTTEVNAQGGTNVLGGDENLREARARAANTVMPKDPDGITRRMQHSHQGLESFGVAAAERFTGRQIPRSALAGETALIDFHGPPGSIPAESYSRVLRGRTEPGRFRGKIVVVGASAPSLQDVHPTSTSGDELMSGPELQAQAISTALRGFALKDSPQSLNVALIVLLGLLVPLASLRLRPGFALLLALLLGAGYLAAAQLAFNSGTVVTVIPPILALAVAAVGALVVYYLLAAFEREQTRDLFSRFVPESVVDDVLAHTDEGLRLGGVRRESTVLFSDLRGFTSFAETLEPDRVIEILNRYLTAMSDAILDHGGTLVAYMGDGIMAVFGAPIQQDDHADRALAAAREMLRRLEGWNDWLRAEGLGEGFKMGIGVNSGSVMSGNVGSERRLEYTAIGDTTNTAARLEGMTKGTPHQLYVSESTYALLSPQGREALVFVDEFEVRGRRAKVRLYSFRAGVGEPVPTVAEAPQAGA